MTFAIRRNAIDSEIFGRNVLEIGGEIQPGDVPEIVRKCAEEGAYCAALTLPLEDLCTIHACEAAGFQFVETKLRLTARIRKPHDLERFAYEMGEVGNLAELEQVLAIAETTFTDDRVGNDPALGEDGPRWAAQRYRRYVEKSFRASDEVLLKLRDRETDRILAFSTFRVVDAENILLLLGGIDPNSKGTGLGAINNWYGWNEYIRRGFRRLTTHVSARNAAIMNLHVGGEGFKVDSGFVVLRKLSAAQSD